MLAWIAVHFHLVANPICHLPRDWETSACVYRPIDCVLLATVYIAVLYHTVESLQASMFAGVSKLHATAWLTS